MRRRPLPLLVFVLLAGILASGCYVNQHDLWASDKLSPGAPTSLTPWRSNIAYGPDPAQHLDVYRPSRPAIGTIIWLHSGGWCCGDHISVDPLILDTVASGYAVIGVDHRRTPTFHLDALASDVDRAIRFVKSKRAEWGIATGRLVLGGGSAGGHLALLLATAPRVFTANDLPLSLRTIDPHVDAAISFVGPTDLHPYIDGSIARDGINGPYLVEQLLDCSDAGTVDALTGRPLPRCNDDLLLRGSPLFWTKFTRFLGGTLPPVYLAYGGSDWLVPTSSQAEPIAYEWQFCAGFLATWLDIPPEAGHNLSYDINRSAFQLWLKDFASP